MSLKQTTEVNSRTRGPSRYSAAQFLVALLLLMCLSPLFDDFSQGSLIESVLLTLVLLSAIPAVGGTWRTTLIASLLSLPVVAGKWIHHLWPDLVPVSLYLVAGIVFAAFVVAHHFRFILRSRKVDGQVLCAGVSTFIMLGLLWSFGYLLLDNLTPESFRVDIGPHANRLSGFGALYFSLGTMTGLSVDEIAPANNSARMLALLEALLSLFYVAILISRLVSIHTERTANID